MTDPTPNEEKAKRMVHLTDEVLAKLAPLAPQLGIDLGLAPDGSEVVDIAPTIPAVSLKQAVSDLAHETGMNVRGSGLYLYQDRLITVTEKGEPEDMEVDRFRTWIDRYQVNYQKKRKQDEDDPRPAQPIKATMPKDVATVLLKSDEFRSLLPEIRRIVPVRLPTWKVDEETGERSIRLLPYGYDAQSQIFTRDTGIDYPEDWTVEQAVEVLGDLLGEFPYADDGRSLSVQVASMLTLYAQLLFPPLSCWPMIYYNANQPGSGKSRLAEIAIYPVYGYADPTEYAENDEFKKALDTRSRGNLPYLFLDDVGGLVKSNNLNRWITSPTWSGRIMHHQVEFSVVNQSLTLLTGNQATLSDDLTRRSLMVDLWSSELASERSKSLSKVIDAEWLAQPENRTQILAAMHAIVRAWGEAGAPVHPKLVPGFEGWSRIVPAIVCYAGYEDPLTPPEVKDAGGKQEVEFCEMLKAAVEEYDPQIGEPVDLRLPEWCRLARKVGVFYSTVADIESMRGIMDANDRLYHLIDSPDGSRTSPSTEAERNEQASRYMDRSMNTKFGTILNKVFRGQRRRINGRLYQFASREARHSTFAIEQLPVSDGDPF